MRYVLATIAFTVIAVVSILGFRGKTSERPPLELFPDMDRQAKYHPQAVSPFFADGRTDRLPVTNTVPVGTWIPDYYLATGRVSPVEEAEFGRGFPQDVSYEMMLRGQERYQIFCAVCHGDSGNGAGITRAYGMSATASLLDQRIIDMSEGEIFNTITWGKNTMGAYGNRVPVEDRWAIILYMRALQRATIATPDDFDAAERRELGL